MLERLSAALMVTMLLTGCTSTAGVADGGSNEALVRSIYEAFARGDAAAVLGTFDSGIVWNEAESFRFSDRNPYVGPDAVAEGVFGRILSDIAEFQVRPQNFISEGDTVVVLGRYKGTGNATSLPLDAQFVHVWRVRDGKVTSFQQYTDTAQFNRVLGP